MTELNPKQYIASAMREAADVPGITPGMAGRDIKKVGVIGAGTMGSGIAVCFLGAGMRTVLMDQSEEAVEKGRETIGGIFSAGVKKGRVTPDQAKGIQVLLSTTLSYDDFADCDLIIEAVFERMDIKEDVFSRLGKVAKDGAVLATNTSGLDVDHIAAASGRPEDVVGLHFFSPAFVMPLLEIVRGKKTSPEVLKTALFASTITNKVGIVVGNCFGFAANRMLRGYGRESGFMLLEGANPEDIDKALMNYGFPMGPCAMYDLAGIDVTNFVTDALREQKLIPDDPRYGAIGKALAAEGRLGQKTRAGNYDYGEDGRTPLPSSKFLEIRDSVAAELGIEKRAIGEDEIVERCLLPVINEAARVLDEGVVNNTGSIDLLWIYGYGFPAAKGGPVYQARQLGYDQVRSKLNAYKDANPIFGEEYWSPSPALQKLFN